MYKGAPKKRNLPVTNYGINTRSKTMQNFHQNNCRAAEIGVSSEEKDFTCSVKATAEAPSRSFEFYVWSDEGINLCIDLNSSTSDWTNRYRNEVCVSENVNTKESRSLLQDVSCLGGSSTQGKCSSLWNTNSGHFDDCRQTKSSPSLNLSRDVTGLDQLNKGSCPSIYDSLTPCTVTTEVAQNVNEKQSNVSAELTVNVADNLKKYESAVSAEVSYGVPSNYIFGAESCVKDAYKNILLSNATDTPFIKSICESAGNSLSGPDTLELQNSKSGHENFEDFAVLNSSCPVNHGILCPVDLLSGSLEPQVSEVASCHKYASLSLCENDGFLDLSNPRNILDVEQCGVVHSGEINFDTEEKNLPSLTEEWEVGKIVNGGESSEYCASSRSSQFDDLLKKSVVECGDQVSKIKHQKKRKHIHSKLQRSSVKQVRMFLRSMKNALTVQPRRSLRLIPKNVNQDKLKYNFPR